MMLQLKPGEAFRCPTCGRTLGHANQLGQVAGKFICRRGDRCEKAKKKEPIEV